MQYSNKNNKLGISKSRAIEETLLECFADIIISLEKWIRHGSGFTFKSVDTLRLSMARYVPLSGGRNSWPALPRCYRDACYILNNLPDDEQDNCFMHCVRAKCSIHLGLVPDTLRIDMQKKLYHKASLIHQAGVPRGPYCVFAVSLICVRSPKIG